MTEFPPNSGHYYDSQNERCSKESAELELLCEQRFLAECIRIERIIESVLGRLL